MENSHGVEQKVDSNDVVVSIEVIEAENEDCHNGSQPKEVHRLKSYMNDPTKTNFSSHRVPKLNAVSTPTMPSKPLDESISKESLLETHLISACNDKANIKAKRGNVRTTSRIEKVPTDAHGEEDDSDDDDEHIKDDGGAYSTENPILEQKKDKKWEVMNVLEFTLFVCIIVVYLTSITVRKIKHDEFWGLEIWSWCVLLLVIFCGRLLTSGFTKALVFLIERNFLLKKKVLYFLHSLKRSVQVFFWLALVLLTWVILIRNKLKEPKETAVVLKHITKLLLSSLFGSGLWVVKTLLVKLLACSFHVNRFFDRIQESIFQQYVLLTLSKPLVKKNKTFYDKVRTLLIVQKFIKGKSAEKQVIDIQKLRKMIKKTVSAWTISGLVNVILGSGLATISSALDESGDLTSEEVAKRDGNQIFRNLELAAGHPRSINEKDPQRYRFVDEKDLLLFLPKEDVDKVFDMFKFSTESRKIIKRKAMREWVVKVYNERKLLAQSIRDAKTAIEEMNRILSGIALIVIIVVWLILMGLATSEMLFFIASQFVVGAFIFGDSCKTGFQCIVFVFFMHPYDIGDHCVIDGVQMTVVEMNILTTIFKSGKETIVYPNSVLATIPISNHYRSLDLCENVEFVIDVSTASDTIDKLKSKIKTYIEKNDNEWYPVHKFKEIRSGNKLKMVLSVSPKNKVQDSGESSNPRPELLGKLKAIFEDLEIKYHYLPQEVHLSNMGQDT